MNQIVIVLFVVIMICLFTQLIKTALLGGPRPDIQLDSPIDLRASAIFLLRLPATVTPPQELTIYSDNHAVYRSLLTAGSVAAPHVTLTEQEWSQINQLHDQWCMHTPTFRPLASNENHYNLGIKCSGPVIKQVKIPIDQLPDVFSYLQKRVPPLPATVPTSS